MRFTMVLLQAMLSVGLEAETLDPKLLDLVPTDARFVFGIDAERYQNSPLASLYPLQLDRLIGRWAPSPSQTRQLIFAVRDPQQDQTPLIIIRGAAVALLSDHRERPSENSDDGMPAHALVDATTGVLGDPTAVQQAIERARQAEPSSGELVAKLRQLSQTYDAWFIAIRPLENLDQIPPKTVLRYREDFIRMTEEVQGGIQIGRSNDLRIAVTMKTIEDAAALAALSRWAPGFLEAQGPHNSEGALVELLEDLTVTTAGNTVSISFSLDESKVEDLVKSMRATDDAVQNSSPIEIKQ